MSATQKEKIYRPKLEKSENCFLIWREMFCEFFNNRELIYFLFRRNFLAKYRQSFLGVIWAVITPFIAIGTFLFLDRAGVMNIGETDIPYSAYALLGFSIWQLFATGLIECTNSIVQAGPMVIRVSFPKETIVISSFSQALFDFCVRLVLIIILFAYLGIVPSWTIIFFPLSLIPLILFTVALGLFFSLLNAIMRDTVNVITIVVGFAFFLTPVLYVEKKEGLFLLFNKINPLTALVIGPRDIVLLGHLTKPMEFVMWSVVAFVLFLISWTIFHLVEPKMAERV